MISDFQFAKLTDTPHSDLQQTHELISCVTNLAEARANLERLSMRTEGSVQEEAFATVEGILKTVKAKGDAALIQYTEKFDGFRPEPLRIEQESLEAAWQQTLPSIREALLLAHQRIKSFHEHQLPSDIDLDGPYGEKLGQRWRPVENAGLYIPGGRAAYPSSVLMNAIPAQVAGVKNIVLVSPAGKNGQINSTVLAAAHLTGVKEVFRIGGAQAIAALAYGTDSIRKVDVISGPGNLYVTLAKKSVFGKVGIDSLAGPSEVLIIADHNAQAEQVAADLLAQAEHDPLAAAILLTTEEKLANQVPVEIEKQLVNHPRAEICRSSIKNWGLIVLCKNLKDCIELSYQFAPEHLELLVEHPSDLIDKIKNAGAIFVGPWSPEAVGDYLAGPNHTLPTSGTARFSGPLNVKTFMKSTSTIEFNKSAFNATSSAIKILAESEGLYSHAQSIRVRSN